MDAQHESRFHAFIHNFLDTSIDDRVNEQRTLKQSVDYLKHRSFVTIAVDMIMTETTAVKFIKEGKGNLIASHMPVGLLIHKLRDGKLRDVRRLQLAEKLHHEWVAYKQKLHRNEKVYGLIWNMSSNSERDRYVIGEFAHQVFSLRVNLDNIVDNQFWHLAETYDTPVNRFYPTLLCEIRDALFIRVRTYNNVGVITPIPSEPTYSECIDEGKDPNELVNFMSLQLISIDACINNSVSVDVDEKKKIDSKITRLKQARENKYNRIKTYEQLFQKTAKSPDIEEDMVRYKQKLINEMIVFIQKVRSSNDPNRMKTLNYTVNETLGLTLNAFNAEHLSEQGKSAFKSACVAYQTREFHKFALNLTRQVAVISNWDNNENPDAVDDMKLNSIKNISDHAINDISIFDDDIKLNSRISDPSRPSRNPNVLKVRKENALYHENTERIFMTDLMELQKRFILDLKQAAESDAASNNVQLTVDKYLNLFMTGYENTVKSLVQSDSNFSIHGFRHFTEMNNIKYNLDLMSLKWDRQLTYIEIINDYQAYLEEGGKIEMDIHNSIKYESPTQTAVTVKFDSDFDQFWSINDSLWTLFKNKCVDFLNLLLDTGVHLFTDCKKWEQTILTQLHSKSATRTQVNHVASVIIHLYALSKVILHDLNEMQNQGSSAMEE